MNEIKAKLKMYVEFRQKQDVVLNSILENDLVNTILKSDHETREMLPEILKYIKNTLPSIAWGSKEKVEKYLQYKEYDDRV